MKSYFSKLAALVGLSVLLLSSASAVTLVLTGNTGMGGAAGGLVGSIDPGSPADLDSEVVYVNNLLNLPAGAFTTIPTDGKNHDYSTTAWNFNGTVSGAGALNYPDNPPTTGPSGFTYVLAKLGNTSFVWFVGGEAFDLSSNFGPGNGLSHWVAFTPTTTKVPDGGATVVLLGLGLVGMSFIARRKIA
ncbi:MAG: VPDSG-CTERM sorting domain-containing protein [Opitutus sp.]